MCGPDCGIMVLDAVAVNIDMLREAMTDARQP